MHPHATHTAPLQCMYIREEDGENELYRILAHEHTHTRTYTHTHTCAHTAHENIERVLTIMHSVIFLELAVGLPVYLFYLARSFNAHHVHPQYPKEISIIKLEKERKSDNVDSEERAETIEKD